MRSHLTEPRPFDLASLERSIELQPSSFTGRITDEDRALAFGVSREQAWRYRRHGLTERQADELAVRVGLHPGNVWRDWFALAAS
jgi:hypothetical protein